MGVRIRGEEANLGKEIREELFKRYGLGCLRAEFGVLLIWHKVRVVGASVSCNQAERGEGKAKGTYKLERQVGLATRDRVSLELRRYMVTCSSRPRGAAHKLESVLLIFLVSEDDSRRTVRSPGDLDDIYIEPTEDSVDIEVVGYG
jgi:hypothetical protein